MNDRINSAIGFMPLRARPIGWVGVLGLMLLALNLGACKSSPKVADCTDRKANYLRAKNNQELQIPSGLETPDRHNELKVPAESAAPTSKIACLNSPPSYFGTAGRIAASPEETVADWAQAWADRNVDAVLAMYSSQFTSTEAETSPSAILEQRRAEVANGPAASGRVKNLKVTASNDDRRVARFTQLFGSNAVQKELTLVRESGLWKIAGEKVVTVEKAVAAN